MKHNLSNQIQSSKNESFGQRDLFIKFMKQSTFVPQSIFTRFSIKFVRFIQNESDELNWVQRRTYHELNSLSLVRLMWSSTFDLGLRELLSSVPGLCIPRTYFFRANSSGVPGVLQGCCLSGMLGVITLFLDGRLVLLAEGVLGVLPTVFGVFALCCTGVFRGVFWDDFSLDGVLAADLPTKCIE